jgi:F0F1-type ATP synthase assembly protein I
MVQTGNGGSSSDPKTSDSPTMWPPRLVRLVPGALVGAFLGWAIFRLAFPLFTIPENVAILPDPPPIAAIEKLEAYQFDVDNKNYGIAFAITGALIALFSTASSFGVKRPFRMIVPVLLGASMGALGAVLCNIVTTKTRAVGGNDVIWLGVKLDSMGQALLAQVFLWGLIGLATGIAVGLTGKGLSGAIKAGISGLLGGALGAVLFLVVSATLHPTSSSNYVVLKSTAEQIGLTLAATISISVAICLGTGERKPKNA